MTRNIYSECYTAPRLLQLLSCMVSRVQLMKRWKRRVTLPLLSSFYHLFLFWSPLVLHLEPPGWYCCRFPLICSPPAVFLLRPLLLVVLPGGLRCTAHLGVGRMVGTLNLLMQPFVAIASELAAPLPGSADRCSRTLPQLPAIGYLLLPTFCVCVCMYIHCICFPNKGNTQIYEQICHMHQAHTSTLTLVQVHAYTNTQKDNKVMSLIFSYSYHTNSSFLFESQYLQKQ